MDLAQLSIDDVYARLETSPSGLSSQEVDVRLRRHGPNHLRTPGPPAWSLRFLRQLTHFLALLLWLAAGLAFLADALRPGEGMFTLGIAIIAVILINAGFAFAQEYRAERAVQALHDLLPMITWVLRNGHPQQVPRTEIVPGDLLILEAGEQVPADARLVEAQAVRVDLASLTGESRPKRRTADPVPDGHLLDLPNLVFAGTTILSGHGRAVVYATGMRSEFGKIARLATAVEGGLSPLQREIVAVTRLIAAIALGMGALFFLLGLSLHLNVWGSAIFGIGIIAANVPEGLLPTVTLALALGSQRMAARRALIKHLSSVETLGCATVICTDKTGTLTENRMRVERLYVGGLELDVRNGLLVLKDHVPNTVAPTTVGPIMSALALCHDAKQLRREGSRAVWVGDPTEVALVQFVDAFGLLPQTPPPRIGEVPFDADRKLMTTVHPADGRQVAYVKGAPEALLPRCTMAYDTGHLFPMTDDARARLLAQSRRFAQQAYRVLAVAMREGDQLTDQIGGLALEQDLTFLGLVAMIDAPHREVPQAIARCRDAGVRVIMVTGDHPLTAVALARTIGLVPTSVHAAEPAFVPVVEGHRMDAMHDTELRRLLTPSRPGEPDPVFARMAPRHKLRVVTVLKEMGEVVAVTGDGVNDAPALKHADIGIAMGVAGTDVAKETADMILLDDNFATIVNAIEEGRAVYDNIKKFTTYVLASNVPEVVPYLAYGLLGWPLALTVPQILAVDLGTDMVPALALGAERPTPGLMERPPRSGSERLVTRSLLLRAYLFLGGIEAAVAMGAFFWFLFQSGWTWGAPLDWNTPLYQQATAVTFAAIVVAQVANVFACRSEDRSVFRLGLWSNGLLWAGIVFELALLGLILYRPELQPWFGTRAIPVWVWPCLAGGALLLLFAEECRKLMVKSHAHRHRPHASARTAPPPLIPTQKEVR